MGFAQKVAGGDFWSLTDCVLQKPKNENWVLLILIRETLNKIHLETVLPAIPFSE